MFQFNYIKLNIRSAFRSALLPVLVRRPADITRVSGGGGGGGCPALI